MFTKPCFCFFFPAYLFLTCLHFFQLPWSSQRVTFTGLFCYNAEHQSSTVAFPLCFLWLFSTGARVEHRKPYFFVVLKEADGIKSQQISQPSLINALWLTHVFWYIFSLLHNLCLVFGYLWNVWGMCYIMGLHYQMKIDSFCQLNTCREEFMTY